MDPRTKGELLYEGKAKRMFAVLNRPEEIWVEYKDSLTAFNAQKKGSFAGKGALNAEISALLYDELRVKGVATHVVDSTRPGELICRKLTIIPLEVVTRNRLAGSTAKKLGKPDGTPLPQPLVEFYYKDDGLGDPFVSDDQALFMGAVTSIKDLEALKTEARKINAILVARFKSAGLELIDFKLEFGRDDQNALVLADEISPDTCRLWDLQTGEKYDKDRFRLDLGNVEQGYREVRDRLRSAFAKEPK